MKDDTFEVSWQQLLASAVQEPGLIHSAYNQFWNYSTGNQMLALLQCRARAIQPGPLASFCKWKELGRSVKKGERALALIMPITGRRRQTDAGAVADDGGVKGEESSEGVRTIFVLKRNWFVLSQTDGQNYVPDLPAAWDEAHALAALGITKEEFSSIDGNAQGYATGKRTIAVSPLAVMPCKTLFHELAHVMLDHTSGGTWTDSEAISRNLQEVEAEAVALLCCESLGLPGAEYSRGYIQHWLHGGDIPERSAKRIFAAADRILKAGLPPTERVHVE